jgi:hypothetical protein
MRCQGSNRGEMTDKLDNAFMMKANKTLERTRQQSVRYDEYGR